MWEMYTFVFLYNIIIDIVGYVVYSWVAILCAYKIISHNLLWHTAMIQHHSNRRYPFTCYFTDVANWNTGYVAS